MSQITLRLQSCSHQWFIFKSLHKATIFFFFLQHSSKSCQTPHFELVVLQFFKTHFWLRGPVLHCLCSEFNNQSPRSSLVQMGTITCVTKTPCLHSTLTYFEMKSLKSVWMFHKVLFANTAILPTNTFMSCTLSKQPFSGQWHDWVIKYNNISEEFASHRLSYDSIWASLRWKPCRMTIDFSLVCCL